MDLKEVLNQSLRMMEQVELICFVTNLRNLKQFSNPLMKKLLHQIIQEIMLVLSGHKHLGLEFYLVNHLSES
jgi:hypothetical protein